jgi:transposase
MTAREVAGACGLGCTTVVEYGYRAKAAGLVWPPPEDLSDAALEALLFPPSPPQDTDRPLPDWSRIRSELSRKGVTLTLLWQEYRREHPNGYRYSRFSQLFREWEGTHSYSMIQHHRPGEKLFVDFSGLTMRLTNPESGETHKVEIFVAATGYSQFIFARLSHADPARLARMPRVRLRVPGRLSRGGRARQSEVRSHVGLPLRTGEEPRLRRVRAALRYRGAAGQVSPP